MIVFANEPIFRRRSEPGPGQLLRYDKYPVAIHGRSRAAKFDKLANPKFVHCYHAQNKDLTDV